MSVFPISFVMNRTHQTYVYNDTAIREDVPEDAPMPFKCIGLTPYFLTKTVSFNPKDMIDKKRYLDTRKDDVQERIFKGLNPLTNSDTKRQLIEKTAEARIRYGQETKQTHPSIKDCGVFESSAGNIAIPVRTEILISLIAFAQQGKIVRLTYDENRVEPAIEVENPSFQGIKFLRKAKGGFKI